MTNEDLIASYFYIDKEIKKCKHQIGRVRATFYSQSMSSRVTSDETHVFSEGFNVEYNVIKLVDTLAATEDIKKVLEFKHKHFKRYLRELPESDRGFLIDKYKYNSQATNKAIDSACLKEIQEIEEAAGYRFKYYVKPENLMEISSIVQPKRPKDKGIPENLKESCSVSEQEENIIETFENDFTAMLKTLGVC